MFYYVESIYFFHIIKFLLHFRQCNIRGPTNRNESIVAFTEEEVIIEK
jgi:hypothetical protein